MGLGETAKELICAYSLPVSRAYLHEELSALVTSRIYHPVTSIIIYWMAPDILALSRTKPIAIIM